MRGPAMNWKSPAGCQCGFAATVIVIMPHTSPESPLCVRSEWTTSKQEQILQCFSWHLSLDIVLASGINSITQARSSTYAQTQARSETRHPADAGLPASASGAGDRRHLRRQRVLRPARPGAGQVRDAPAGTSGRAVGQLCRGRLRAVTTPLLPGAGGV